jgi:hypothetical protein
VVEKKEGATMTCQGCGERLVCRMSNYKHPYANKLQWQNQDGTAHYKFDGGKFSCTGVDQKSKQLKQALIEQDEFLKEAELSKGEQ